MNSTCVDSPAPQVPGARPPAGSGHSRSPIPSALEVRPQLWSGHKNCQRRRPRGSVATAAHFTHTHTSHRAALPAPRRDRPPPPWLRGAGEVGGWRSGRQSLPVSPVPTSPERPRPDAGAMLTPGPRLGGGYRARFPRRPSAGSRRTAPRPRQWLQPPRAPAANSASGGGPGAGRGRGLASPRRLQPRALGPCGCWAPPLERDTSGGKRLSGVWVQLTFQFQLLPRLLLNNNNHHHKAA